MSHHGEDSAQGCEPRVTGAIGGGSMSRILENLGMRVEGSGLVFAARGARHGFRTMGGGDRLVAADGADLGAGTCKSTRTKSNLPLAGG